MNEPGGGYLLDNRAAEAGERFEAMAAIFDPTTFRHLGDLGVAPGWRCWEVGAGGPSVARWLAEHVGSAGRVLATDIDLTWLTPLALAEAAPGAAAIEVRRHDVAKDPPPAESFDVVHARLVLVHLPERERVLRVLAQALHPGGWLLIEDADPALQPLACIDAKTPAAERANRLRTGFRALLVERGAELAFGRQLPRRLREAGLDDVAADAYFPVALPASARLEAATIRFIRGDLVRHGIATDADVDAHLAAVAAGELDLAQPPMISAWGRRR
jgi:ubiquinone/menaquinone biosynthesis C-methylase UbiE